MVSVKCDKCNDGCNAIYIFNILFSVMLIIYYLSFYNNI
jgi:hypothetical protein